MDTHTAPLRTGGRAWGPERVKLGLSLNRLAQLSGVNKGILSQAENGRLIPSGKEWTAVMDALARAKEGTA